MKLLLSLFMFLPILGNSFDKLDKAYLVTYGDPKAKIKITYYYTFSCPHCAELFQRDFYWIKSEYINTGLVSWTFHPLPMDPLTVRGMHCLENINLRKEKKIFFELIFEYSTIDDDRSTSLLMNKAMEYLLKPLPDLLDKSYLGKTPAWENAFLFLKQQERVNLAPTIEINGKIFLREIPSRKFISRKIEALLENKE